MHLNTNQGDVNCHDKHKLQLHCSCRGTYDTTNTVSKSVSGVRSALYIEINTINIFAEKNQNALR